MKRLISFFGMAALLSMAACQRENENVATDNPNYDPDTQTVKTEFVLNISTSTGKDTKTSAEYVQENGVFLGLDAAHLLTYTLPYTSADTKNTGHFFYTPVYGGEAVEASRDYNLGALFPAQSVTTTKSSRTVELSLPLGTNAVMLYGKALKSYSDDQQGKITMDGDPKNLTTLYYRLTSRLQSQNAFDAGAFVFSRILNYFLVAGLVNENSGFWNNPTGTEDKSYAIWYPVPDSTVELPALSGVADKETRTVGGVTYTCYKGQVSWRQMGRMYEYDHDDKSDTHSYDVVKTANGTQFTMSALTEVLGDAYYQLTTVKKQGTTLKELRAGSAQSFLRTVRDLYAVVERCAGAEPTVWEEQVTKLLAQELKERMDVYFVINSDGNLDFIRGTDGNVVLSGTSGLLSKLETRCSPSEWSQYGSIVNSNLDEAYFSSYNQPGFPVNVGLPFGAAILDMNKGTDNTDNKTQGIDAFYYTTDIPAYGFGTSTFPIANYRYPAELMYFGNSPIRVSDSSKKASEYPATVTAWNTEGQWTGWTSTDATVSSSTRAVAMINNINYGTALLESTVKYASGVTTLLDNNSTLHPGEEDNSISVSSGSGLKVTGLIVAGQADEVGWDYVRRPDNGAYAAMSWNAADTTFTGGSFDNNKFDKMIYDKVLSPFYVGAGDIVYTMVWDNYDATKSPSQQADVYVGLELLNDTGEDFWGEMNLVRQGGTFYILGKLDLSDAIKTAQSTNAAAFTDLSRKYYYYPPFDPAKGATVNVPRVFMQDYRTTANLIIGKDALKHAYVTLPDLRSSQVSLGLSIDMAWTPGLAFDVEMGKME